MRDFRRVCWIASIGLVLVACSKPAPDAAPATPAASVADTHETVADDEEAKDGDPCSLLEPKEVEAVLGQPLGTPPFVNPPDDKSRDHACRYVGNDLREVDVEVTWSGATMVWKMFGMVQGALNQHMKGMLKLADGTELAGEWDEARVQGCCTFMALLADQIVEVNVAGSKASIKDAAALADAALKRIGKPLAIKGADSSAAAAKFFATHRPAPRGPCDLVSRAEAELLIGPLAGDPKADGTTCHYALPATNNLNWFVDLKIRWEGGYRELRESADLSASVAGGFGLKESDQLSDELTKALGPVSWESMHTSIAGFSAVKRDVMISADTRTGKSGDAVKLVAKAMSKI
jgi:hypothetical protein